MPEPETPRSSFERPLRRAIAWAADRRASLAVVLVLVGVVLYARLFGPPAPPLDAPGTADVRYLGVLAPLRSAMLSPMRLWLALPLVGLALLAGALLRRAPADRARLARPAIALATLFVAAEAELVGLAGWPAGGGLLFAAAMAVAGVWWQRFGASAPLENGVVLPRRIEVAAVVALLALTAFLRLVYLESVPYGIEGDESKWTTDVVRTMIDGTQAGPSALGAVPMSYYMQAPFHRVLGPSIDSARLAVVWASVLASAALYLLLRRMWGVGIALAGTGLLAVSLVDISASRLANVESHVKLWAVLPFLALWLAFPRGGRAAAFLAGLALGGALLTYDTLAPVVAFGVAWAAWWAWRGRSADGLPRLAALLLGLAPALPLGVPYLFGRRGYYGLAETPWMDDPARTLVDHTARLLGNVYTQTLGDFLLNRPGPLLNGLLVPFLVLGLVALVANVRRPPAALLLGWFAIVVFPTPIALGVPVVRVLYPAWPAICAITGAGVVWILAEASAALPSRLRPVLAATALAAFGGLGTLNLYVYLNEVEDRDDRRLRRELRDTTADLAGQGALALFPFVPGADEAPRLEEPLIYLAARSRVPRAELADAYAIVDAADLPLRIATDPEGRDVAVVMRSDLPVPTGRGVVARTLARCYPGAELRAGAWLDTYLVSAAERANSPCRPRAARLDRLPSAPGGPVELSWTVSGAAVDVRRLVCEVAREGVVFVEAESFGRGQGWRAELLADADWEGAGYLTDRPGSDAALYVTNTLGAGEVVAWARTRRDAVTAMPAQLSLDTQTAPVGVAPAGVGAWAWERVGVFQVREGDSKWVISRPPDPASVGAAFAPLWIDAFALAADRDYEPGRDAPWRTVADESAPVPVGELTGTATFVPPGPGRYRCRVEFPGAGVGLDAAGNRGLSTDTVEMDGR